MENENKGFEGVEKETELTPEERVREDISSKIADAAAELEEEIMAADTDETEEVYVEETMDESWSDEAWEDAESEEEKPEPVRVTVKRNTFIMSLIASAIAGALILLVCMQIPSWLAAMPEGSKIASVDGQSITDLDVKYYIYVETMRYAQEIGLEEEEIATYNWDEEVDGVKISDTIKQKAMQDAIDEVILIQKGAENGAVLTDEEKMQMDSYISSLVSNVTSRYGEHGVELWTKSMGVSSIKQYEKMYEKVLLTETVENDLKTNPDKYYPEDVNVLNQYIQPDGASVKHILIATESEDGTPVSKEEKYALAQTVLERAKSGEDFDALVEEFNDDPGVTNEGYTFAKGEMQLEFETASFALKIGEISDVVETVYGYHIIKRIPGMNELKAYWAANDGSAKISERKLSKFSINEIMTEIFSAREEFEAQLAA